MLTDHLTGVLQFDELSFRFIITSISQGTGKAQEEVSAFWDPA